MFFATFHIGKERFTLYCGRILNPSSSRRGHLMILPHKGPQASQISILPQQIFILPHPIFSNFFSKYLSLKFFCWKSFECRIRWAVTGPYGLHSCQLGKTSPQFSGLLRLLAPWRTTVPNAYVVETRATLTNFDHHRR